MVMKIEIKKLENLLKSALRTKYDNNYIELMLPVIMFGELAGVKSHGIIRVCSTGESILSRDPKGRPQIISRTKIAKLIDAKGNPGMLVGAIACNEVIKIAKKMGVGVVGTKGSTSSSGSLTYYLEKIVEDDLIAMIMARAPSDVAPFGGLERLLGTNPMSFGIPADTQPFIHDMATAAISYGAVARAKGLGEELPEGVAIDVEGNITRDAEKALRGAFLTFDRSYKGFGLSMIVEILAGVLPGANFLDLEEGDGWGNLFIAFDPNILSDIMVFKEKVRKMVERVRNSRSKDGDKIRIPGENKIILRDKALEGGWVDVDEKILDDIKKFDSNMEQHYLK